MKRLVPSFYMLFFLHASSNAQNLVANGSFEDENLCTEFHKYCAPEAWIATSGWANYYFGDLARAYDGFHYVGLTAGNINKPGMRNFIRTRLLCGLRKGHQYHVEFYVSANNRVLDSIGVYFSADDFLFEKRSFRTIQPVYWYMGNRSNATTEKRNWKKVEFVYTATGDEGYMVIGLFKRSDYTGMLHPDFQDDYFFFLDKVSLTAVDPNEKICAQADQEKYEIYQQNDRHNLLDQKISAMQQSGAKRPHPALTRMPLQQHVDTLIIPDIYFVTASYELSQKSNVLLDSFSMKLAGVLDSIVVKGHTDSVGTMDYNKELSLNRAVSVKGYLLGKVKTPGVNIIARGYAYLQPVASNRTSSGRRRNRRVEILVYRKD